MQLSNYVPNQLLDGLQDIVDNIEIQSNFCISHPDYKPLEILPSAVARFQQLPEEFQRKYLRVQLRNFIYSIYFTGDTEPTATNSNQNSDKGSVIEQNSDFYWQLHASNCGEGYFDPSWYVHKQESDGRLAVQKNGLTLHIEPNRHLQPKYQLAKVGDTVAIRMPRNLVETGFYIAVGNAGRDSLDNSNRQLGTVYIYFNISPPGAIAIMSSLTEQLNSSKIGFTFKALSNPSSYPRNDSGILYFERSNYKIVRQVLQSVYAQNQSHFLTNVPLFTKLLAPGLSLAEKPEYKETTQERFGLNRCQIVADGLLDAWHNGDRTSKGRLSAIIQRFKKHSIELERPYLNANEDIYTPL